MTKPCFHPQRILLMAMLAAMCLVPVMAIRAAEHATVLMYHRFGEDQYPSTNIRLEQFEAHLEMLSSGGYNVIPLADIVAKLQNGESLPDRTVAITIDDAYLSVYEEAWPRLRRHNFPAKIFVATRQIDIGLRG
ncbi:MAG: polysaccharide deacetylase family protein, partial [Alphaproteobacteria bacterium]